jgi:hypothetical protein
LAKPVDGLVQPVLEIHVGATGPEAGSQVASLHYGSRLIQKHGQHLKRLLRQTNFQPMLAQFGGIEIHLECPESN